MVISFNTYILKRIYFKGGLAYISIRKILAPKFRLWFEHNGKPILGKGGALLLEKIARYGSIQEAIKKVSSESRGTKKISYRYGWGLLKKIGERLGHPVVIKHRGGLKKGGTELSEVGKELLRYYNRIETYMKDAVMDEDLWEALGLKISARNKIEGEVVDLQKDKVIAKVKIEVTLPATITAVITREAVDELNVKVGDKVFAVIKSTEVMIATD